MAFSFKDIKNNALRFITDKIANSYPDIASKYRNNNQNTSNLGSIPSHQNSTVIQPEPINITVPGKDGNPYRLPNRSNNPTNRVTAEDLYETFDPYGLATESAKVLIHPNQQTYSPEEIKRIGKENYNYGENPELGTGGGQGGSGYSNNTGHTGGSGVVIVRYLTTDAQQTIFGGMI